MPPFWLAIIAYILGIIIAILFADLTFPYPYLLIVMGILIIALYNFLPKTSNSSIKRQTTRSTIYTIIFLIILTICGITRTTSTIDNARKTHGDLWQRSVYQKSSIRIPFIKSIQSYLTHQYAAAPFDSDERSIIEAMTIGHRETITRELRSQFSRAGVSHILALSGMHITIIYIFLQYLLCMHLSPLMWRRVSSVVIIIMMWIYAMIAGMSPSLIRAVTMCSFLTMGYIVNQRILSSNALALSAFFILLYNPLMLLHVGFQLSYLSIIAIISIGIPLCNIFQRKKFNIKWREKLIDKMWIVCDKGLYWVWCTLAISFVCSLYTAPLVAYYFGEIPLLSPVSNVGVGFFSTILICSNGVWLLTGGWAPLAWVMNWCASMIVMVTDYVSNIPHAVISFSPTIVEVLLAYIILVCSTLLLKARLRHREHRGHPDGSV